jgi:adenylate kinase
VKVYVVLGAPGAGKGTQASELSGRLGLPHVASGDLFRQALREGTQLGLEARQYMDRGALVPDDITIRMIGERLQLPDAIKGVILDGFPRTRHQAEALDDFLARRGAEVGTALYVLVGEPELLRRLSGRLQCEAGHTYQETSRPPLRPGFCDVDGLALYHRQDDNAETIRARLAQQLAPMAEVVGYYRDRDTLATVDGEAEIGRVTDSLLGAIGGSASVPASSS